MLVGMAIISSRGSVEGHKKMISILHGIGVFLLLLGGFGMLARLGIGFPWPGWLWVKLVIWFAFAGSTVMIRKSGAMAKQWTIVAGVLVALAAIMAILKPF